MIIDWNHQLIKSQKKEIEICTGPLKANIYRFTNGMEHETKTGTEEQLIVVLSGECDIKLNGGRYRLNAGSWINLPAQIDYRIHVFRSCEDCCVLCVSAVGYPSGVTSCNMLDMPEMNGEVYFGLECGNMTGILKTVEQQPDKEAVVVQIMHDDELRKIIIMPGKEKNIYPEWLKEQFGILWEHSIMSL